MNQKVFVRELKSLFQDKRRTKSIMPYCPECGGEMHYTPGIKRYACKSCGLSVTHQELIELREQMRSRTETDKEQHQRERREYLKWWLSNKKK